MEPNLFDEFHPNSDFTESYTDIWHDNSQTFESELSNNLQGILPMFGNNNTHYDHDQDMVAKICHSENQYFQSTSSPTVEIIQVDPNCVYGSPERNDYTNDSDDDDGDSVSSYDSDTSTGYSDSQEENEYERQEQPVLGLGAESSSNYSSSDEDVIEINHFDPTPPTTWLTPANFSIKNSFTAISPKKRIQRKSFSLPESPVHETNSLLLNVTSLTYEDLNLQKPIYTSSSGSSSSTTSSSSDDDENVLVEPVVVAPIPPRVPPLKLKNLTALSNKNIITKGQRQSGKKATEANNKILAKKPNLLSDDSESSDVDVGVETIFNTNKLQDAKKQLETSSNVDNLKTDPTWSPTKLTITSSTNKEVKEIKKTLKVTSLKAKPIAAKAVATTTNSGSPNSVIVKNKVASTSTSTMKKVLKVNPINNVVPKTKVGLLNAAGKYSKNMMNLVTKPLKTTSKLDHDYCTLKKQANQVKPTTTMIPRKIIEIPFDYKIMNNRKRKTLDINNQRNSSNGNSGTATNSTEITKKESNNGGSTTLSSANKILEKTIKVEQPSYAANAPETVTTTNGDNLKCDNNKNNANNPEIKFNSNSNDNYDKKPSELTESPTITINHPDDIKPILVQTNDVDLIVNKAKKKLNLEEYKKRRCNDAETAGNDKVEIRSENVPPVVVSILEKTVTPEVVVETQKVKQFLNVGKGQYIDPISAAQQKALRQRELKKAAMEKSVEAQILKATPLLPILPLAQLTGTAADTEWLAGPFQKEYEEIIIVSIACNTDVTIPINTATEAIAELYSSNNIVFDHDANSTQMRQQNGKNVPGENIVISTNSLLSSIQDVVIKKSTIDHSPPLTAAASGQSSPNIGVSPPNQFSPGKPETSKSEIIAKILPAKPTADSASTDQADKEVDTHGEDKIIMHLKKDRVLPKQFSIGVQTQTLPQFPLLKRLKPIKSKTNDTFRERRHSSRRKSRSRSRDKSRERRRRNYRVRSPSRSSERSRSELKSAVVKRSSNNTNNNDRSRERKSSSPDNRRRRYSSRSNSPRRNHSSSHSYRRTRSKTSSRRSTSRSRYQRNRTTSSASSTVSTSRSSIGSSSLDDEGKRNSRYHKHQLQRDNSRKRYRNCSTSSGSQTSSYSSRSKSRSRSVSPKRQKQAAERAKSPDERRIVYVGRIENELTKDELKQKFVTYGEIKQVTLHFKDSGIRYGFVTFDRPQDAFAAIDASTKDVNINMYDISFGGRRQFCRAQYSDLDGLATTTNSIMSLPYFTPRKEEKKEESFEEMLKKVKAKICAKKTRQS